MGRLRKLIFGIRNEETSVERRGFRVANDRVRLRIEQIGRVFVGGYHAALECDAIEVLVPKLQAVDQECLGFAFEGAAMGLALQDFISPWRRNRIRAFLEGAGDAHTYMVHVAIGWAVARLPVNVQRARRRLDPLLGWLMLDGYGFHEGFFHWPRYLKGQPRPRRLQGYECRAFDQGLGRSLWFVDGGEPARLSQTISEFPASRQLDLWSGVGLACAYAGGVAEETYQALRKAAGPLLPELAQGTAFAAKARQRAGNMAPHTEMACRVICGSDALNAARLTDQAKENLTITDTEPAFEMWRRRVQAIYSQTLALRP